MDDDKLAEITLAPPARGEAMSDTEKLIAEISGAHKAVSRMIIDGTLRGWTDSAHAAHRDRATLLRMLDEATAREARLRDYILGDARCPCCATVDVCLPDCTFSSDSPEGFERMGVARAALAPEVKS